MRNRNNPLKNIPDNAFTVIHTCRQEFFKYLADIPVRYPQGRITYITDHPYVSLIAFREEHQDRLDHLEIQSFQDLLRVIDNDCSAILFIEYKMNWVGMDDPENRELFISSCKKRARQGIAVVVISAIMDQILLEFEGTADYFFQMGRIELKGKRLAKKEQTILDGIVIENLCPGEKRKLFGQMKLGNGGVWE